MGDTRAHGGGTGAHGGVVEDTRAHGGSTGAHEGSCGVRGGSTVVHVGGTWG